MRINIAEPCNENWEGMGPNPQGKHCSKCEKTVYDFSSYTDSEIISFFKEGPSVCGRFNSSQLGRDLSHTRMLAPKWAIAACGLLFFSSASLNAQNEVQVSKDSGQENVSQMSVILTRVINATFNEASTQDACISRMRIKIDSFSIDVDVDSSRKVSVTIPQKLSGERVNVELFNIKGDTFHLDSVNLGMGDIVFNQFGNIWTYILPTKYEWVFPEYPPISYMGVPSPYIWGPPIGSIINLVNTFPIDSNITVTMGDTISNDLPIVHDSIKTAKKERTGMENGNRFQLVPWSIGILIGLGSLLFLVWRKFKNKIKA